MGWSPVEDAPHDSTVFDPEAQTRRELVEVKCGGYTGIIPKG
jgi:hypothetical protein